MIAPYTSAATEAERIVLQALIKAANSHAPCPSNNELAELLGASSTATPVGILRRLQARGIIRVERFSTSRQVTIVASGRRTKIAGVKAPHWRDRPEHAAKLATVGNLGPRLAELIRGAAAERGQTLVDFVVSVGASPTTVGNLTNARAPRAITIARFLPVLGDKLRAITPPELIKAAEGLGMTAAVDRGVRQDQAAPSPPPAPPADMTYRPLVRTLAPQQPGATIPPRPQGRLRTFEEQLAAVAAGAGLIEVRPIGRPDPARTLGGVGSSML